MDFISDTHVTLPVMTTIIERSIVVLFLISVISFETEAQSDTLAIREITKFQNELNAEYKNPKTSPLNSRDIKRFTAHDFFPIDLTYRVVAKLTITSQESFFKMKTTSARLREYRKYGEVEFSIRNKEFKLNIYQSRELMKKEEYKDYLFLPFTDLTNDVQSYAGGRYLGLRMPLSGNEIVIDFNQTYNPYCAYSPNYSCPIVPAENHLEIEIPAGVRHSKN